MSVAAFQIRYRMILMFIPDPASGFFPAPHLGSNGQKSSGSQIPYPEHCEKQVCTYTGTRLLQFGGCVSLYPDHSSFPVVPIIQVFLGQINITYRHLHIYCDVSSSLQHSCLLAIVEAIAKCV